ncbi:MAG TPA: aminotransferase class I/II-fold pyridoxal phosphate-dependent enzyme, partial [Opitutales bacterium]|nr:aminotransferase class I/II-fold pyridoxal phosphate-dependent enzyme [Opitutales bacterium]
MTHPRLPLSPPHLGPDAARFAAEAVEKGLVAYPGPHIAAFEEAVAAYTGTARAAALSSCTAALHLALVALGLGKGDLVLTSDLTFVGSANPISYTGAEPVFVGSDAESWNLSPALLEEAVADLKRRGKRAKALVLVHLYGLPARADEIAAICSREGIVMIEDCAESLGTFCRGRHTGSFGRVGCLSFNGNKIITTGGGGMAFSDDAALVDRMVFLATQAREKVPYYLHNECGYNYRMSNVLAALGAAQMNLVEERVARRREIFARYRARLGILPGVTMMPDCADYGRASHWLSAIVLSPEFGEGAPERLRLALEAENIESRRIWRPMHLQPLFKGAQVYGGAFG